MPAKKTPTKSKPSLKQQKNKPQKTLLTILAFVLVVVIGTFVVYRSQAASHIVTLAARPYADANGYWERPDYEPFDIPNGKSTLPGVWVRKSGPISADGSTYPITFTMVDYRTYTSSVKHQACFAIYNSKSNRVGLRVAAYYGGTYTKLADSTIAISGKGSVQTHCITFKLTQSSGKVVYVYEPLSRNGVIYKVTVVKD